MLTPFQHHSAVIVDTLFLNGIGASRDISRASDQWVKTLDARKRETQRGVLARLFQRVQPRGLQRPVAVAGEPARLRCDHFAVYSGEPQRRESLDPARLARRVLTRLQTTVAPRDVSLGAIVSCSEILRTFTSV